MANFTPEELEEILQQFFDVTGKRQYIGARYVPIFGRKDESSIIWDNSAPYEPLTIVLYQGNSYTSRTYVPEGVEITNTYFWANTGNYNAQVEQYRRDVNSYREEMQAIGSVIPASSFTAENTVEDAISAIGALMPASSFTAENTVAASIAALGAVIPASSFTAENTVVDYIREQAPYVLVSDYGAKGDGVTDDTQAIQAAVDICRATNAKKTLVFEAKTYLISSVITLGNLANCHIVGNGATIAHNTASAFNVGTSAHDIEIEGFRFSGGFEVGDTTTSSNYAIGVSGDSATELYQAYNINIHNCYFTFGVFGIAATNVLNLNVSNCYFTGGVYRPEDNAGGYAILTQSCVQVAIERCFFVMGDYGRHDIYISVSPVKTTNIESKNVYIHDCFSDRSNMATQSGGAYYSPNTARCSIRSCYNFHLDGFYAIGGCSVVSIGNENGEQRNAVIENVYQYGAKYISASIASGEGRACIAIVGMQNQSNYIDVTVKNLQVVNPDPSFLDVTGEADKIILRDFIITYRITINNTTKDTFLILENIGVHTTGIQYTGATVLKGSFHNVYSTTGNHIAGFVVSNEDGAFSIDAFEPRSLLFRLSPTGTITYLNNLSVHPNITVDTSQASYRKITIPAVTKPNRGFGAPFGTTPYLVNIDVTHDAGERAFRVYITDTSGTSHLDYGANIQL